MLNFGKMLFKAVPFQKFICWTQDVSYFTERSGNVKFSHHLLHWTVIDVHDVTRNVCGFQENMKEKIPPLADEFWKQPSRVKRTSFCTVEINHPGNSTHFWVKVELRFLNAELFWSILLTKRTELSSYSHTYSVADLIRYAVMLSLNFLFSALITNRRFHI